MAPWSNRESKLMRKTFGVLSNSIFVNMIILTILQFKKKHALAKSWLSYKLIYCPTLKNSRMFADAGVSAANNYLDKERSTS